MKTLFLTLLLVLFMNAGYAQLKSQEQTHTSVASSLVRPVPSMSGLLSWFNPDHFSMRHSFSLQYMAGGGYGLSLATYTNTMFYQIADPLNLRFDVSLQGSPFGGYGFGDQANFNRLFLSRAELNYQPWENFRIQLQYRQFPYGYYGMYSPFYFPTRSLGDD
jgi:hypothetical protein